MGAEAPAWANASALAAVIGIAITNASLVVWIIKSGFPSLTAGLRDGLAANGDALIESANSIRESVSTLARKIEEDGDRAERSRTQVRRDFRHVLDAILSFSTQLMHMDATAGLRGADVEVKEAVLRRVELLDGSIEKLRGEIRGQPDSF